ncbi:hypothetical protein DRP05_12505 [Archaeoglobales archaeon]|nr:MAG: hypothetical protein DRP05_12505 [Archaeoglobales archaeon]
MRIAIVAPYFHPVEGGRERTVLFLAKELAKKHFVKVFTTDRTPSGDRIKAGFKSCPFSVRRVKSVHIAFRFEIPAEAPDKIAKEIKEFDIVHIISTDSTFTFYFLILAKMLEKPILATVFTPFALLKHPRKILRPFLLFFEFLSVISMRLANAVQVKNEIDFELARKFSKSVKLVPDGVPEYCFKAKPSLDFREKYELKNKKIILFVNRIHPLKGPQILIRAMPKILRTFPEAVAVLIGPDSNGYTTKMEKLAAKFNLSDSVLFLGFVSEDEKIAAYDAADVIVIPSVGEFTEAFSIVLSEAWVRKKTVVVTPSRALKSRVKPGTGYVAGYEPESFAEAVIRALEKPVEPPKVSSWSEVAGRIEQIYLNLIK